MKQVLFTLIFQIGKQRERERLNNLPKVKQDMRPGNQFSSWYFHCNSLQTSPVVCPIWNCGVLANAVFLLQQVVPLPCSFNKNSRRSSCFSFLHLYCCLCPWYPLVYSIISLSSSFTRGCCWPIKSTSSIFFTLLPLLSFKGESTKGLSKSSIRLHSLCLLKFCVKQIMFHLSFEFLIELANC